MVIIMILSTINITAICTFCFKGINALNAYRSKCGHFCFIKIGLRTIFAFSHVWRPQLGHGSAWVTQVDKLGNSGGDTRNPNTDKQPPNLGGSD